MSTVVTWTGTGSSDVLGTRTSSTAPSWKRCLTLPPSLKRVRAACTSAAGQLAPASLSAICARQAPIASRDEGSAPFAGKEREQIGALRVQLLIAAVVTCSCVLPRPGPAAHVDNSTNAVR